MTIWSSETIRTRVPASKIISKYRKERVKHGAYELALGRETLMSSTKRPLTEQWSHRDKVCIPPGQIAMLITEETVSVPNDAIGLLSIKASQKLQGLINVSGFHVDPGFQGKLKFSVYNAGSTDAILEVGEPLFLIWFLSLDAQTADCYSGSHHHQDRITSKDVRLLRGRVASPQYLNKRLARLRREVTILWALLAGVIVLLAPKFVDYLFSAKQAPNQSVGHSVNSSQVQAHPMPKVD